MNKATAAACVGLSEVGSIEECLSRYNFEQLDAAQKENALNDLQTEIERAKLLVAVLQNLQDYTRELEVNDAVQ